MSRGNVADVMGQTPEDYVYRVVLERRVFDLANAQWGLTGQRAYLPVGWELRRFPGPVKSSRYDVWLPMVTTVPWLTGTQAVRGYIRQRDVVRDLSNEARARREQEERRREEAQREEERRREEARREEERLRRIQEGLVSRPPGGPAQAAFPRSPRSPVSEARTQTSFVRGLERGLDRAGQTLGLRSLATARDRAFAQPSLTQARERYPQGIATHAMVRAVRPTIIVFLPETQGSGGLLASLAVEAGTILQLVGPLPSRSPITLRFPGSPRLVAGNLADWRVLLAPPRTQDVVRGSASNDSNGSRQP